MNCSPIVISFSNVAFLRFGRSFQSCFCLPVFLHSGSLLRSKKVRAILKRIEASELRRDCALKADGREGLDV